MVSESAASETEYLTEVQKYYKMKKGMLSKKEQSVKLFGYKD